jgi:hypothetical protein
LNTNAELPVPSYTYRGQRGGPPVSLLWGFSGFLCGFSAVSLRFLCGFYNPEKPQRNHRETREKPERNYRETREKPERNQRETREKPERNQRETREKPRETTENPQRETSGKTIAKREKNMGFYSPGF